MKLTGIAAAVGFAVVMAGCLDFEEAKTCNTDSDCLEGRVCDLAKKVCAAGTRDAGFVSDAGEPRRDGAEGDVPSAPDSGEDVGFDVGVDSGADVSYPSDVSDASDDAADAGFDTGDDTGTPDAGEDTGAPDTGEDAGVPDAGADTGTTDAGCVPDCTGKECGDNGCGGSCGGCGSPPASTCPDANTIREYNPVGSCAVDQCAYLYNDRTCQYGCANGKCNNCTPDCAGKTCGLDGCGGSCGNCTTCLYVCDTGVCAAAHQAFSACDTGDVWWFDSCSVKEELKTDCTAGQVCYNNACCTPGCAGKCGGASDGCTGTCSDPCSGNGTCAAGACTCATGYTGASCNSCDSGYTGYPTCVDDPCLPDPCNGHASSCDSGTGVCTCATGYTG
ncbi:MAG: hypothetical protein HY897_20365, partial [Deltaproteobacteria bacterium]|nr:hypothetical protein [Deltaproteobacteria bacterium]